MAGYVEYNLIRGLPFERKLIIKDRFTHRQVSPEDPRGWIKTGTTSKIPLTCTVDGDRGIFLSLTAEETLDLPTGALTFDVLASLRGFEEPMVKGYINVSTDTLVTPTEESDAMEFRFAKHADFRRNFTWRDDDGDLLTVTDAFLQAKDAAGATVIDLRWYASTPNEATVLAMSATQRGYLSPYTGATMEMHISNANSVPAGSYAFDLYVKDNRGDWERFIAGTIVVEAATSSPPV